MCGRVNGNFHPTYFRSMFGMLLSPEWPGASAKAGGYVTIVT
ncbi:hypothetical protein Deipe_1162 [Deinococcus peraridilitoris DSM 19664]|uniref:Uncharacterized protein n=1 Tax=Deinococcus peraridilitoris (strain DSM 19664 / LMG 22246 / CIP 109416 / KR-200) TaxID=937777 RepID=L0A135_DEIPD|nr:hypothetical protein Deipe_1162 [Deinococcus peraridilitoris DSM 19664]